MRHSVWSTVSLFRLGLSIDVSATDFCGCYFRMPRHRHSRKSSARNRRPVRCPLSRQLQQKARQANVRQVLPMSQCPTRFLTKQRDPAHACVAQKRKKRRWALQDVAPELWSALSLPNVLQLALSSSALVAFLCRMLKSVQHRRRRAFPPHSATASVSFSRSLRGRVVSPVSFVAQ